MSPGSVVGSQFKTDLPSFHPHHWVGFGIVVSRAVEDVYPDAILLEVGGTALDRLLHHVLQKAAQPRGIGKLGAAKHRNQMLQNQFRGNFRSRTCELRLHYK